jgi:hypothetical protein
MQAVISALLPKLASFFKSKWTHYSVLLMGLLMSWGYVQNIYLEKKTVKAELEKLRIVYENQAKDYKELYSKYVVLKKQIYTMTVTHPDGTVVVTTSEYVDSTISTSRTTTGSNTPIIDPLLARGVGSRLPISLIGFANTASWGMGAGYELASLSIPLLPDRACFIMSGTVGQTWESKWAFGGALTIQFERVVKTSKK